MNLFSLVFGLALIAQAAVHLWLDHRQIRHVARHHQRVPEAFATRIALADHQKAADYTITHTRFAQYELLLAGVLLLIWTLGGGLDLLDRAWRHLELPELITGVGVMLSAFALVALLDLPAALYRTYVIEERFGFNRTTPKVFFYDLLKRGLLLHEAPLFRDRVRALFGRGLVASEGAICTRCSALLIVSTFGTKGDE